MNKNTQQQSKRKQKQDKQNQMKQIQNNQNQHQSTHTNTITQSTILVTGGAGFIGSHLVNALANSSQQNKIIIIDNLSTGKIENIAHFFNKDDRDDINKLEKQETKQKHSAIANQNKKEEQKKDGWIECCSDDQQIIFCFVDIRNRVLLQKLFEKYTPDYVFHLAALASVPKSMANPKLCHDINVTGTFNILHEAKSVGTVKKVVFSSSCAVYGNPDEKDLPLKESTQTKPASPYAASKLIGEQYCRLFTDVYKLPCIVLRYFNVYGKRQDPDGDYAAVIPKFIEQARNDQKLIIYGDGKQTRDFIYVDDVVRTNILAAVTEVKEDHSIINVGTGFPTDVEFLARTILILNDKELDLITYKPKRSGDIQDSYADNRRLEHLFKQNKLGIPLDLKSGLIEMLDIDEDDVLII